MPETAAKTASVPADPAGTPTTYQSQFIAQLASIMANQLNNILMAITSSAELEMRRAPAEDKHTLELILSNTARATSLIQRLLVFSRQHTPSARPLRLNALISETGTLIRNLAGDEADVSFRLSPGIERVVGDEVEVQRLVLALALNTVLRGGRIAIATEGVDLDADFLDGIPDSCPGRYAVLSIEESGISSSKDAHEVESFRASAISAAKSIAQAAGGLVQAGGPNGAASQLKIYFPEWGSEVVVERPHSQAVSAPLVTILIVEDDDGIRLPATEFLKMEGYKILQARTGPEALRIALRNRSALDLLITDIVMPEMSGHEVAASLLELYPKLKVLYMSGDPSQGLIGQVVEEEQRTALQKPFSLRTLQHRIQEILS